VPLDVTRVDLVIPTRNSDDRLRACLATLEQSLFQDFRLFVFDDASREPVGAEVLARWPNAHVVRSTSNVGLAAGCNAAIDAGQSEYVVLLNDDTEVDSRWLGELVACADRHPNSGSIASKMLLMSDRGKIHSAGDFFSVRGMPGNRGAWLDDLGQFDREQTVFSACGGAALYRRSALDSVRLERGQVFDERLFMYCEDVDLAWRLQRAHWSCVYAPRATIYHHLSATGGGVLSSYLVARNVWLILSRSIPRSVLAPYRSRIVAYHAGRVARMIRHAREPAARAALRGTFVGLLLAFRARRESPFASGSEVLRLRALLSDVSPPFRGM
jgi:GT2 family glycosyltransferase